MGGNLQEWEEQNIDRGRTNVAASYFLLPSLQMNLATRPPGECNETAPCVREFSNNNRLIPEAHIKMDDA